jgi:hypothetical protein
MPTTILAKRRLIPGKTSELVLNARTSRQGRPAILILRVATRGSASPGPLPTRSARRDRDHRLPGPGQTTAHWRRSRPGTPSGCLRPLGEPTHTKRPAPCLRGAGGTGIAACTHIAKGHHQPGTTWCRVGPATRIFCFFTTSFRPSVPVLVTRTDGSMAARPGHEALRDRRAWTEPLPRSWPWFGAPRWGEAETTRPFGVKTTVSSIPSWWTASACAGLG